MPYANLQGREWVTAEDVAALRGISTRQALRMLHRLNEQSGGRLLRTSPTAERHYEASTAVLRELLEASTAKRAKEETEDETSEIELLARVEAMETKLEALRELVADLAASQPWLTSDGHRRTSDADQSRGAFS